MAWDSATPQAAVAAVDGVASHPAKPAPRRPAPARAWLAQLRLVLKVTSSGYPPPGARRSSVQDLGRYRSRVDQRHPTGAAYARAPRDLAVLLLPTVPVDWRWTPAERSPFLHKTGLVQHQHRAGVARCSTTYSPRRSSRTPSASTPEPFSRPLHPIRGHLTGLFGQPPAVLARNLSQQPLQVRPAPGGAAPPAFKPPTDALVQLDQPICPYPGLLLWPARPPRSADAERRTLRHIAASLDRKAGNLPQPNCDCRTRSGSRPGPAGRWGATGRRRRGCCRPRSRRCRRPRPRRGPRPRRPRPPRSR